MFREIEKRASDAITEALKKLEIPVPEEIKLEEPPNPQMGTLQARFHLNLQGP